MGGEADTEPPAPKGGRPCWPGPRPLYLLLPRCPGPTHCPSVIAVGATVLACTACWGQDAHLCLSQCLRLLASARGD